MGSNMATNKRRTRNESTVPEIKMTREVKLKVRWRELSSKLGEVLAQGFLTALGGDGISAGISALMGATSTIKIDAEPGEKAWSLAVLCFAWALDELKTLPETDVSALRKALDDALGEAKAKVDDGQEYVPITFLQRPTTLPLYRALRDAVVARKDTFRFGIGESDDALKARFDSAYDRAMFEVYSRRADVYQSLGSIFSSDTAQAAERQINWATYRSGLIYEFEVRPVFGQEATRLSLSQLYVPLRACWPRDGSATEDHDIRRLSHTHDVLMLDDELEKWVRSSSEDDSIRLIGGGPGSGKSTTLRAFARRMADRQDLRPLFIPLQYIDLEGDLREAVNRYFVDRTSGSFTQPPLSRTAIEDGPPLLLIFDGLDELARPGEAANEVVNLFSTKLANMISSLRGDGSKSIKVVVSGRMPSFQAAKRYISPPKRGCLEVYGFTPPEPGYSPHKKGSLWSLDQRPIWWRQYASLVGGSQEVPPAFTSDQLRGITHEPLLCYLLVLSGFATANWEQAAENPNRIYKTLVDSIWERGWGEGGVKRQGPGRTLSKADFNTLMQTIALAAWQGGDTRIATEPAFAIAIKIAQVEAAWESFKNDNGPDITNLALNFYLKAAETGQRGFEFTHKTFGDYLAARAIFDIAEDLATFIRRKVDHAMTDWVTATGSGSLSKEVLTFLRDEVRLRTTDSTDPNALSKIIDLKRSFEQFINAILVDGLPASMNSASWRVAETRQRNAETMAWAVMNALSLTIAHADSPEKLVRVDWPDVQTSFHGLLRRLSTNRNSGNPALSCFSYVVAPQADLFGLSLFGIDLRGSQMQGANFAGCLLIDANLSGANLEGCNFERAMLDRAQFERASLIAANLIDARITMETTTNIHPAAGPDGKVVNMKSPKEILFDKTIISEQSLLYADLEYFSKKANLFKGRSSYFHDASAHGGILARNSEIKRIMKEILVETGSS
jgi:uncharacterized protein YjbI with pentapeptide repeats